VHRKKNAAFFNVSFIALGFILGDTHPHEGANQTPHGAADSEPGKSAHDRAGRDKRTDPRNRKSADPGQQAKRPADHPAGRNAGGGAFRRFCVLLMGKVFRALSENLTERPLLRYFLHPLNREEPTLVTAIRLAGDAAEVTGLSEMRREQGYD